MESYGSKQYEKQKENILNIFPLHLKIFNISINLFENRRLQSYEKLIGQMKREIQCHIYILPTMLSFTDTEIVSD